MKEIGNKLQTKRQSLKLSYQDIAKMTKMPEEHIKAIERGDIDYFKNDITYLRFYVRAYCKALGIDFEAYKNMFEKDIDDFTQTLSLKAIKEREEIEENIASRTEVRKADTYKEPPVATVKDRGSIRQNANQAIRFRKKPRLDISLISLLVIVVVVIGVIVFVVFNNSMNPSDDTANDPKVNENTTPTPESNNNNNDKPIDIDDDPKESGYKVSEQDPYTYLVEGLKRDATFKIEIKIAPPAGFKVWASNTKSGVIGTLNDKNITLVDVSSTEALGITYEGRVGADDTYVFNFKDYASTGVSVFIDGKKVDLNATLDKIAKLTLVVKGVE